MEPRCRRIGHAQSGIHNPLTLGLMQRGTIPVGHYQFIKCYLTPISAARSRVWALTARRNTSMSPPATWFSAHLADTLPALGCASSELLKLGVLPSTRSARAFNEKRERNYDGDWNCEVLQYPERLRLYSAG